MEVNLIDVCFCVGAVQEIWLDQDIILVPILSRDDQTVQV